METGGFRQTAVVAAYVAGGILLAALLLLQVERIALGDRALWTQSSDS